VFVARRLAGLTASAKATAGLAEALRAKAEALRYAAGAAVFTIHNLRCSARDDEIIDSDLDHGSRGVRDARERTRADDGRAETPR
jgi:hypothetical protein